MLCSFKTHNSHLRLASLIGVVFFALAGVSLGDWPQFRGPNGSGLAQGSAPIEFGPGKNERWRVDLGIGHSSPCVVGNSIFLTSADKEKKMAEVIHIDRRDGRVHWRRSIALGRLEQARHPSFNLASSTPVSDGERVVAYFGSIGLICFDLEGTKVWEVKMPPAKSFSGNAVSPVMVGDRVILYRANYVDHFLQAVDTVSGKTLWKKPQAGRFTPDQACSATPVVAGDRLIVHGIRSVRAIRIADGETIWQLNCKTSATSSPVVVDNDVVVATWNQTGEPALVPVFPPFEQLVENNDKNGDGQITPDELPKLMYFHRSEGSEAPMNGHPLSFRDADSDGNKSINVGEWEALLARTAERRSKNVPHGLVAIPLKSKGVLKDDQIRYLARKNIPEVPSPIVHKGRVYLIKNGGVLTCLDLATGEQLYRMRTGGSGTHYASPIIADDKLYIAAGNGEVAVLDISGPEAKLLAANAMGQGVFATPAIVHGMIYVRTHRSLFAFGQGF